MRCLRQRSGVNGLSLGPLIRGSTARTCSLELGVSLGGGGGLERCWIREHAKGDKPDGEDGGKTDVEIIGSHSCSSFGGWLPDGGYGE